MDADQLFDDLGPGGGGSYAGALDLRPQFLVLDQLTGVFHGKHHGPGCIPLGRRGLSLFHGQSVYRDDIAFFQRLRQVQKSLAVLFGILLQRTGNLQISLLFQFLCSCKETLPLYAYGQFYILIYRRRIKNAQKAAHDQIKYFSLNLA